MYVKFTINNREKRLEGCVSKWRRGRRVEQANWINEIKGVSCFLEFYDFSVIFIYFSWNRKAIFYTVRLLCTFQRCLLNSKSSLILAPYFDSVGGCLAVLYNVLKCSQSPNLPPCKPGGLNQGWVVWTGNVACHSNKQRILPAIPVNNVACHSSSTRVKPSATTTAAPPNHRAPWGDPGWRKTGSWP